MKKIVLIIGARPNFMKAFPVYEVLKDDFELTLIHTGQHYDEKMSKVFFEDLKFPFPDISLSLEKKTKAGDFDNKLYIENQEYLKNKDLVIEELLSYNGDLGQLGEIRDKLLIEFEKIKPDLVMVFGDVTSTLSASLASKKLNIKIAHVESGLRSFDLLMPEEVNRILTDYITDYYFVTEQSGVDNLKNEGKTDNVYLVGNTMIDTQIKYLQQALATKYHEKLGLVEKEYILITLHRPSNVDNLEKLKEIFDDLIKLSKTEKLIYPIHPRTKNNLEKIGYLDKIKRNNNIILEEPLGYLECTCLMAKCKYVITDSGGLQEETTALDIPCFTLRENTERPCTLINNGGTNQLINKISEIKFIPNIFVIGSCRVNFRSNNIYNPIFYSTSALDIEECFKIMFEKKNIIDIKNTPYFNLNLNYKNYINLVLKNKIFILEVCSLKSLKYLDYIIPYKCLNNDISVENITISCDETYIILNNLVNKYNENYFVFIPPIINNTIINIANLYDNRIKIYDVLKNLCNNNYNCIFEPYPEEVQFDNDLYHICSNDIKNHYNKIIKSFKNIKKNNFISINASKEIKNILYGLYNKIYISLGYGCRTTSILKKINIRKMSLPFDYLNCDLKELLLIMKNNFEFANNNNLITNNKEMYSKIYGKNKLFLHYNDKYRYISLINRFKNILKTPNKEFISIYLNNGDLYRKIEEYLKQYNELNMYIMNKYHSKIKCIIINNNNFNDLSMINTNIKINNLETPLELCNEIKYEILKSDRTINEIINSYLNYNNDIEFHNNILELLKLSKENIDYEDYIYVEIGKLYKKYMKCYNLLSLSFFEKSLKNMNGKCNYESKLCFYYENCIYSLKRERALMKIISVKENIIKPFYLGMYKYINNIENFELDLKQFLESGKKIYQSIPLKTYIFSNEINILDEKKHINEYNLEKMNFNKENILLITSCDINYFYTYEYYIIESFLRYNKNTNLSLIIDIIVNNNLDLSELNNYIKKYNVYKNINISIKYVNCKNIKAFSSTLRFIRAYYQNDSKCLIIDIDSIILKPLENLLIDLNNYDIGSRILEDTYPWQKYTAGFCYFNNTIISKNILQDIFICLNNKMNFNDELWWIDQNCLEYGIRKNKLYIDLKIKNYFGIKDEYIISPTGSKEEKIKLLKSLI